MKTGAVLDRESIEITDAQYKKILAEAKGHFERGAEELLAAARVLGELSTPRLTQAKRDLRGYASADWVERLALFGRGIIARHLALKPRSLPANILKRMHTLGTLEEINKPSATVEVYDPKIGTVVLRKVEELNAAQLAQVTSVAKGLLSASEQKKRFVASLPKIKPAQQPKEELVEDGFLRNRNEGYVTMFSRFQEDPPNTRRFATKIRLDTLRKCV